MLSNIALESAALPARHTRHMSQSQSNREPPHVPRICLRAPPQLPHVTRICFCAQRGAAVADIPEQNPLLVIFNAPPLHLLASAIGKNMINAKTFLEKRYNEDIGIEDAIHTALLTLKEGFEGQVSGSNIEVGIIGPDRKFRVLTEAEVSDYLEEVE
eukprot:363566-Chlamydomonas_euryale.AAC.4